MHIQTNLSLYETKLLVDKKKKKADKKKNNVKKEFKTILRKGGLISISMSVKYLSHTPSALFSLHHHRLETNFEGMAFQSSFSFFFCPLHYHIVLQFLQMSL